MERRPPSTAESALRAILASYGLVNRLSASHFAHLGITGPAWGILRCLQRAEDEGMRGMRVVDLGEKLLVQPPSVSTMVSRLKREGLLAVRADAHDRRAREVSLTVKGRALLERGLRDHPARVRSLMGGLSEEEHGRLLDLLGRLNGHLREMLKSMGDDGVLRDAPTQRRASA